jgi:hypothetical protein
MSTIPTSLVVLPQSVKRASKLVTDSVLLSIDADFDPRRLNLLLLVAADCREESSSTSSNEGDEGVFPNNGTFPRLCLIFEVSLVVDDEEFFPPDAALNVREDEGLSTFRKEHCAGKSGSLEAFMVIIGGKGSSMH